MATIVTRYINAASVGGDGTTSSLTGGAAAYNTISAWQTAEAKDLVTANEIHKIEFSGGALFNNTLINDAAWVTDIDHFLWFTVATADRFYGVLKSGFYIYSSARYDRALYVAPGFSIFEYLDVEEYVTGWRSSRFGSDAIVFGCHYKETNQGPIDKDNLLFSCLFTGASVIGAAWYNNATNIINCTMNTSYIYGFRSSKYAVSAEVFNSVAIGATTADFDTTYGAWLSSSDYNASQDLTPPGTNSITSIATSAFTDTATEDYTIAGTTSPLYAAGSTLAAIETKIAAFDRTQYTIPRLDITGNALPTILDIGAFSYTAAIPTTTPVTATAAAPWDNYQRVSQSEGLVWNSYSYISTFLSTLWGTNSVVLYTNTFTWDDYYTVSQSDSFVWDTYNIANASLATPWNVYQSVSEATATPWDAYQRVSQSDSFVWGTNNLINYTNTLPWSAYQSVIDTVATPWDNYNIVSHSDSLVWDSQARISVSSAFAWDNLALNLSLVTSTVATPWDMAQVVSSSMTTLWDLYVPAEALISMGWDMSQVTSAQIVANWDELQKIQSAVQTPWDAFNTVLGSAQLDWSDLEGVQAQVQTLWDMYGSVAGPVSLVWTNREVVSGSLVTTWDLGIITAPTGSVGILVGPQTTGLIVDAATQGVTINAQGQTVIIP